MDDIMEDVKVKDEAGTSLDGAAFARGGEATTSGMDDGEDEILREIDVLVKPQLDVTTQLYLLQYPMRPFWRPYNLEERCQEVRIKPQHAKLEVDLDVDVRSNNYDQNASEALRITKQTLSSSHMDLQANYAIGLLRGDQVNRYNARFQNLPRRVSGRRFAGLVYQIKSPRVQLLGRPILHLSPLHAAVQLKPSLSYLDAADEAKKKEAAAESAAADEDRMEVEEGTAEMVQVQVQIRRRETERQEENRLTSYAYLKQQDEAEEWVPLRPYLAGSQEARHARDKMLASSNRRLAFDQPPEKYIADVTPGRSLAAPNSYGPADGLGTDDLTRGQLESLNLSDRFKLLLSKGQIQVLQFDRLMKLAPPDATEADVLTILKNHAMLVQGCWVAGSSLRYRTAVVTSGKDMEERKVLSLVRDYFLLLFTKRRFIKREEIEHLRLPQRMVKEIMTGIAAQRTAPPGWDFIEPTDRTFMKKHKEVVEDQVKRWATAEDVIRTMVTELDLADISADAGNSDDDVTLLTGPDSRALVPVPEPKREPEMNFGLGPGGLTEAKHAPPKGTMSQQTRVTLIQVLRDIFTKHGVCTLEFLRECLVKVARGDEVSGKKMSAAEQARVSAAGQGVAAPPQELALVVGLVARQIREVFVLTSLGKAEVDPFRNVVIQALIARPTLRKGDVLEAAKLALKCEVPQTVYTRVLKELCVSRGGVWVLRSGDGS